MTGSCGLVTWVKNRDLWQRTHNDEKSQRAMTNDPASGRSSDQGGGSLCGSSLAPGGTGASTLKISHPDMSFFSRAPNGMAEDVRLGYLRFVLLCLFLVEGRSQLPGRRPLERVLLHVVMSFVWLL
ncbi:hypothetical protein VFPBJ_11673 [Purpureocillium lilacinum]|uniref:Uncharacterized protein n=1 Tax=Purpureocillium lilacinum TaxID=33203 RepID=A0A179EZX2_PURLI|nr:hypothetical protein VFPBJ_11673 [Purpureocillium lilacinum]